MQVIRIQDGIIGRPYLCGHVSCEFVEYVNPCSIDSVDCANVGRMSLDVESSQKVVRPHRFASRLALSELRSPRGNPWGH